MPSMPLLLSVDGQTYPVEACLLDKTFPFHRYLRATPGAEEFLRRAQVVGDLTALSFSEISR